MRRFLRPSRGLDIENDLRAPDLLQVLFGLQLINILMTDHIVARITDSCFFDDRHPEIGAADDLRDAHCRVNDHIDRHVLPGVEGPSQAGFDATTELTFSLQREFPVDVHLVPGNLGDHDHGPDVLQAIQRLPQGDRFPLYRERRDLRNLPGQSSQKVPVSVGDQQV